MKARSLIVILGLFVLLTQSLLGWGLDTHRYITERAIRLLPASIRPFFEKYQAFVVEHSVDPDLWRSVGFTEELPRHFLDLDAYGTYPFLELPRDYNAAVKKFGREKVDKNGQLPWRTAEMFDQLVKAFENQKTGTAPYVLDEIKLFSAVIAHYVSDAHVPFHAVTNYDGQLTNQQGIHTRWETELFLRYRDRLSIRPSSPVSILNPRDFIFEALRASFQDVESILKADRKAAAGHQEYDDSYFEKFFTRTRPTLEHELSQSITAVASTIASAWERAGKPKLPSEFGQPPHKILRQP